MLESFVHPKSLKFKSGQSIVINGVNIYNEMRAAFTNYIGKQYKQFGKDVGVALALTYIGANDVAKLNPDYTQEIMIDASQSVVPLFDKQVYDAEDNLAYVNYLDYIS